MRALPAFVVVLLAPAAANADWPVSMHDAQRTSASLSTSDIANPAVYWKARIGGALGSEGLLVGDVDLSGMPELVYLTGGSVKAVRGNGQVIWQTPPIGYVSLNAIDDFDGDGKPDVLVAGTNQAILLRGKDGSVEWSENSSDLGTVGALRVGDLNGDGRPDLITEDCHCCALANGASGYAYTFTSSGAGVVGTLLWSYPPLTGDFYSCGVPTVLFDAVGNGGIEIAHAGESHVWILGSDGTVLVNDTNSPSLGSDIFFGDCIPANVDGAPGEELVCFQRIVYASVPSPRQVYVLHYDPTSTPPSESLLWQNTTLADSTAGGDLDFEPDGVVDLDGNGTMEVVVAGLAGGTWTTYVLDAASGATLATLPGQRTAGPLRSDHKVNILTSDNQAPPTLTAWTFDATQSPAVQTSWSLPNAQTVDRVDPALLRTRRVNTALVAPDLNHDGIPDAFTQTASVAQGAGGVDSDFNVASGTPMTIGTHSFGAGSVPIGTWVIPGVTESYAQVAVIANGGQLSLFNDKLDPDTSLTVGGFCGWNGHNSPLLASLTGAAQSLIANGSSGALLRFDAANASLASAPQPQWQLPNCVAPSVVPGLDGANPGIVCRSAQMPPTLSAVHANGSLIWNVPASGTGVAFDALPGSPTTGATPTLLIQTVDSNINATTSALSGATGQALWSSSPVALTDGLQPFAVSDWNGDGVLDVLSVLNTMRALSGVDGQPLAVGATHLAYAVPLLDDLNNDGTLEAIVQAGPSPMQALQHDLNTALWTDPPTLPYPAGALAPCPAGPQLVEGSRTYPSRLYFTPATGASAGAATYLVLAGGTEYPTEAAASAAGSYLGQLTDVAIGSNLTGTGHPTALVGSSDGWLYALDACAGTLQFVVPFGESVCGAILGDTDGNGKDEILVATNGGYIYDVQNAELPSPAPVLDTDPPQGITNQQVATIVTQSTLYGAWHVVPGATSYQVAISTDQQTLIGNPPWRDAGMATSGQITNLPLVQGQRYHFVARAVGPQGRSVDAISSGVKVIGGSVDAGPDGSVGDSGASPDAAAPDASITEDAATGPGNAASPGNVSGGGCGCRTAVTHGDTLPSMFAAAMALAVGYGRRRREVTLGRSVLSP